MVEAFSNGVVVVDGLVQGNQAAIAARMVASILKKYASDSVISSVRRCRRRLMMTRGAVITLARLELRTNKLSRLGFGNAKGVLLRADAAVISALVRLKLHGGLGGRDLNLVDSPQQTAKGVPDKHFKGNEAGLVLALGYLEVRHE